MKAFIAILAIVVVLVLAMMAPAIPAAVKSFRTDVIDQNFTVATGGGVTTANVSLSKPLWDANVSEVVTLSSSDADDATVASSYNGTGYLVTLTGLAENTTRTISMEYRTGGLNDYAGADTGITKLPSAVLMLIIIVPLALIVALFVKR